MTPKEYGKWKNTYQTNVSSHKQSLLTMTKLGRLFSSAILHPCSRQQFQRIKNLDTVLLHVP